MGKREELGKRFCPKCGSKLVWEYVGAEQATEEMCGFGDCFTYHPHDKFDEKTGKRQFVKKIKCPKYNFFHQDHTFIWGDVKI